MLSVLQVQGSAALGPEREGCHWLSGKQDQAWNIFQLAV